MRRPHDRLPATISRRQFLGWTTSGVLIFRTAAEVGAQEGAFLRAEEAPRQLFPDAAEVAERTVELTPDLRQRIRALLGHTPTLWERGYRIFTVMLGNGRHG